jgi:ATP-dependent exoDNAse (exonuclease V) alpha subunit
MWKLEHTVRGAARGWELTVNFDGNEIVCDGTKLDALVLAYETTIHKARDQITQL